MTKLHVIIILVIVISDRLQKTRSSSLNHLSTHCFGKDFAYYLVVLAAVAEAAAVALELGQRQRVWASAIPQVCMLDTTADAETRTAGSWYERCGYRAASCIH